MQTPSTLEIVWSLVTDPTALACIVTASLTAAGAAYRALTTDPVGLDGSNGRGPGGRNRGGVIDQSITVIESGAALLFPVMASFSLILLFFFFSSVAVILNAISVVSSSVAIGFTILPVVELLFRTGAKGSAHVPGCGQVPVPVIATSPFVMCIMLSWLFTGHWFLNNIIGCSLCVLFVSFLRMPSLRVATILLSGLFVYDVFWVFFSEQIFGKNVMVDVATKEGPNPMSVVSETLHLPFAPIKNLPLPAKLIFPRGDGGHSMLGLGDIVLPALFLAYVLRFDAERALETPSPWFRTYFPRAMVGYACGLFLSFFFNVAFRAAQPALLYLVPGVVLPVIALASSQGDVAKLWENQSIRRHEPGDAESPLLS